MAKAPTVGLLKLSNLTCTKTYLFNPSGTSTETQEEEEEFFLELTGSKRIVPITKEGESDEAHDQILTLNLYRYSVDGHNTCSYCVVMLWQTSSVFLRVLV